MVRRHSWLLTLTAMCVMIYISVYLFPVCESHDCCSAEPLVGASAPTHHWLQSCLLPAISSPICGQSRNRAWHFTCWLCVSNFIIYALCLYNWQKMRHGDQSSPFSGLDGATKTGPVTLMIFKRSPISLGPVHNSPSKFPVPPGGNCAWLVGWQVSNGPSSTDSSC